MEAFSFGVTVNFSNLTLDSSSTRLCEEHCDPPDAIGEGFVETANDNRVSYTIGLLIKPIKGFSIGAVYSKRPEFSLTSSHFYKDCCPAWGHSEILQIPDSLSLGFSLKPMDQLSVNMDIVRTRYSQLMDGYRQAMQQVQVRRLAACRRSIPFSNRLLELTNIRKLFSKGC